MTVILMMEMITMIAVIRSDDNDCNDCDDSFQISFHFKYFSRVAPQQCWFSRALHNIHYKINIQCLMMNMISMIAMIILKTYYSDYNIKLQYNYRLRL